MQEFWLYFTRFVTSSSRLFLNSKLHYFYTNFYYRISNKKIYGAYLTFSPAAAQCILTHFADTGKTPEDYDVIVTGDLGIVGTKLLNELIHMEGQDISSRHLDCGNLIFDSKKQNTGAGGSGCGCSASVFCGHFCNELQKGNIKRMLLVCTGALMSPTTYQLGENVVGIAHAVSVCGKGE